MSVWLGESQALSAFHKFMRGTAPVTNNTPSREGFTT
jgi:hypothetical protein